MLCFGIPASLTQRVLAELWGDYVKASLLNPPRWQGRRCAGGGPWAVPAAAGPGSEPEHHWHRCRARPFVSLRAEGLSQDPSNPLVDISSQG